MAVLDQILSPLSLPVETGISEAAEQEMTAMVHQYARFVYQVAYSVLRSPHDAEDAAQETFLRVMRHQKRLPEVRDRRAWLARIAWRVALDGRKGRSKIGLEASQPLVEDRSPSASPEQIAGSREMLVLVERLMSSLPEDLRSPLLLSTIENLTASEIGHILGIPQVTVRTRLCRARKLLREKLATAIGGEQDG